MLTQVRLKELVHYNPETGLFTWISSPSRRAVIGAVLNRHHISGYLHVGIDGSDYLLHRLAFLYMDGKFPDKVTDHINRIRTDNRFCNLRSCTIHENTKNAPIYKNNTSGISGIRWVERDQRWRAGIGNNHIGYFKQKWDAICAKKSAEAKLSYHVNHGREL